MKLLNEMTFNQAKELVQKDVETMTLEELQEYRVKVLDALRYATGYFGDKESYENGFYKIFRDAGYGVGFTPKDKFLTTNLNYKLEEVEQRLDSIYNADKYDVLDYDSDADEFVVIASFPTKREANKFLKANNTGNMVIQKK